MSVEKVLQSLLQELRDRSESETRIHEIQEKERVSTALADLKNRVESLENEKKEAKSYAAQIWISVITIIGSGIAAYVVNLLS